MSLCGVNTFLMKQQNKGKKMCVIEAFRVLKNGFQSEQFIGACVGFYIVWQGLTISCR